MKKRLHPSNTLLALGAVLVLMLALTAAITLAQTPSGEDPQTKSTLAAIAVVKTAESSEVEPDSRVTYNVIFSNTTTSDITLDVITDVLPAPFLFWGVAALSEIVDDPVDQDEPEIVWKGTFTVPASDTLRLRYYVQVPDTAEPRETAYTNTVTAAFSNTTTIPVQEAIKVVSPDVSVAKTVSPNKIELGASVTYTVVFDNDGNADAVIDIISDTLPQGFTFEEMLPGGTITDTPVGTTGSIIWTGPFTLETGTAITLAYKCKSGESSDVMLTNSVVALIDDDVTEPATATVEFSRRRVLMPIVSRNYGPARFEVTLEASAAEVAKTQPVIFTMQIKNAGTDSGEIAEIRDTLPTGFVFQNMETNSDVTKVPAGTTGTISWQGPFEVAGGQTLTLIFKVNVSDQVGDYVNSATVIASKGIPPHEPATLAIKVKEPYLLWEDFESGTDGWEPFLNYWRLYPEQWYTKAGAGYEGTTAMNHTYYYGVTDPRGAERGAHDALYMYMGQGSAEWTNYRYSVRMRLHKGEKGEQMGIWFRGKYTEPTDPAIDGKYVEGYYVTFRIRETDSIGLLKLRDSGGTAYHFSDPELLVIADYPMYRDKWYHFTVEVVGSNIKVFIDGVKVIDHNDSTWTKGTVGFFAYKIEDANWDNALVTPLP